VRAKLGKRDRERVSVSTFKWVASNFIEKKSPIEPKITVHMKHFAVLIQPVEKNVFLL